MSSPSRTQLLLALVTPLVLGALASGCAEGRSRDPGPNACGDGVKGSGEECDDGDENSKEPDACRPDCTTPKCGDDVVDSGEDCDDGNTEGGDGCDPSCRASYICGDEVCAEDIGESCSTCAEDCCPCGDAVCTAGEICTGCPQDCCVDCGNGVLDVGEACDDGNQEPEDGCGKGCVDEDGQVTCGNGLLESGEICDDGNTVGADGCGADCTLEYICGDGQCFKDVGENCLTCLNDCCPNCGDSIVNDFEDCDGVVPSSAPTCQDECYPGGNPSCSTCMIDFSSCTGELPECGNGTIECGEECDDDELGGLDCETLGYQGGTLRCNAECALDIAACGEILHYYRQDFDEGCPGGWIVGFPWQCGVPAAGPGSALSEPNVLTTGLAGNYPANQSYFSAAVTSPVFSLAQATNPAVTFSVWHDVASGDAFQVQASTNGTTYNSLSVVSPAYGPLGGWTGLSGGWRTYTASLIDLAGQDEVTIRFALSSDSFGDAEGVFIDDVLVAETCGNGVVDEGEVCDGDAFGADACPDGTCGLPTCAADCLSFETDSCITPDCGNGTRECDETCDQNDFDGATCDTLGYDGGTLDCNAQCTLDVGDCGELLLLLPLEGFETCPPSGWTVTGVFECGAPTSGPGAAYAGSNVVATNLDGDYTASLAWASNYVQTPEFTVAGPTPALAFWAWIQSENSYDGLRAEVSTDGSSWSVLEDVFPAYTDETVVNSVAWDGPLTAWTLYTVDLSEYDGDAIRVRLSFASDSAFQQPGAYIDDVIGVPDTGYLPFAITAPPALPFVDTISGVDLDLATSPPDVNVTWSITAQTNGEWASIDAQTGELSGTPLVGDVGAASITVRATSVAVPANFDEITIATTVVRAVYSEDFDPCPADFTYTSVWECGDPTSGPANAHSGANCIGTNTYTDDIAWGSANATSPVISLAGTTNPRVSFWMYSDFETCCDGVHLEVSANGGAWQLVTNPVPAYSSSSIGSQPAWSDFLTWTRFSADLGAYAGQNIQLRWTMRSDGSVTAPGPFVDDVAVLSE